MTTWRIGTDLPDGRQDAPSAVRNRDAILGVLRRALPHEGTVLEIGSGTGQHALHFAAALPRLRWQPSDPDPAMRASIAAWIAHARPANVAAPLAFDIEARPWPVGAVDAVVCINVLHVAPWRIVPALFGGAAAALPAGAPIVLYGPYRRAGTPTAESNERFDAQLRAHDPAWGLRSVEDVARAATVAGIDLVETVEMPANNLCLVLRRQAR
jgi:SAM-dependent methyltransferase